MKKSIKTITQSLVSTAILLGSISASAEILPEWHGFYQGECEYQAQGTLDIEIIPMTIEILPVSANEVSWSMHYYRASGDIVKNYTLRAVDESIGHYVTDENNGILIDQYLRQNRIMTHFEVNNNQVTGVSELNGNTLSFTNYAFSSKVETRSRASGSTVYSYGDPGLEKCELMK